MPLTPAQAAANVEAAQKNLATAEAAAAALAPAATGPRAPEVIIIDLFDALAMRVGNRPQVRALIDELKAATAPKE